MATVKLGQSGATTGNNGSLMSSKRDHKFNEKKGVREEKVTENGMVELSMADATIRAEGKPIRFKLKLYRKETKWRQ